MAFTCERLTFDSSDGKHTIAAHLYLPVLEDGERPKAIIQFSHGMTEYSGRYTETAAFFADHGYIFAINDHLGHGESVSSPDELGFFAEEDGPDTVVSDLYKFSRILRERFAGLPLILIGHSMGSFLARLYAMHYGSGLAALVILGTGGPQRLVGLGKALARFIMACHSPRYRSKFLKKVAMSGYNAHYGKGADPDAWLTSDAASVQASHDDPLCGFTFTAQAYYDLFDVSERVNRKDAAMRFPKNLPVFIASGLEDPVGNYGKGPSIVYDRLTEAGLTDVTMKLYPGARHELQHEFCKDEFFNDVLSFIEKHVGQ